MRPEFEYKRKNTAKIIIPNTSFSITITKNPNNFVLASGALPRGVARKVATAIDMALNYAGENKSGSGGAVKHQPVDKNERFYFNKPDGDYIEIKDGLIVLVPRACNAAELRRYRKVVGEAILFTEPAWKKRFRLRRPR